MGASSLNGTQLNNLAYTWMQDLKIGKINEINKNLTTGIDRVNANLHAVELNKLATKKIATEHEVQQLKNKKEQIEEELKEFTKLQKELSIISQDMKGEDLSIKKAVKKAEIFKINKKINHIKNKLNKSIKINEENSFHSLQKSPYPKGIITTKGNLHNDNTYNMNVYINEAMDPEDTLITRANQNIDSSDNLQPTKGGSNSHIHNFLSPTLTNVNSGGLVTTDYESSDFDMPEIDNLQWELTKANKTTDTDKLNIIENLENTLTKEIDNLQENFSSNQEKHNKLSNLNARVNLNSGKNLIERSKGIMDIADEVKLSKAQFQMEKLENTIKKNNQFPAIQEEDANTFQTESDIDSSPDIIKTNRIPTREFDSKNNLSPKKNSQIKIKDVKNLQNQLAKKIEELQKLKDKPELKLEEETLTKELDSIDDKIKKIMGIDVAKLEQEKAQMTNELNQGELQRFFEFIQSMMHKNKIHEAILSMTQKI